MMRRTCARQRLAQTALIAAHDFSPSWPSFPSPKVCRSDVAVAVRTHMNHGGGGGNDSMGWAQEQPLLQQQQLQQQSHSGQAQPRTTPLTLGLEAARATSNILRLLEVSTQNAYADTLDTIWHPQGLVWQQQQQQEQQHTNNGDDKEGVTWNAVSPTQAATTALNNHDKVGAKTRHDASTARIRGIAASQPPLLEWLNLLDDRTALAKIVGMDGLPRYVSMLRLDAASSPTSLSSSAGMTPSPSMASPMANDGWQIVRQVVSNQVLDENQSNKGSSSNHHNAIAQINTLLANYLSIEHGGGKHDKRRAESLFAPQASLLAVDSTGNMSEISLDSYLGAVESQTPHSEQSKLHDAIVQIDVLLSPTSTSNSTACAAVPTAAAATVHVGNGAQTTLFVDHLLLGRYHYTKEGDDDDDHPQPSWKILSKIYTPRAWPSSSSC